MAFGAPRCLNGAAAVFLRRGRRAGKRGETVGLHVAGGEPDGEDGKSGVDGLREEVGAEGQAADVFKHYGWGGVGGVVLESACWENYSGEGLAGCKVS